MPIGVPMRTPSAVSARLPTMAFKRPPAEPGGGVFSVKTASDSPPKPSYSSTNRISTSQPRPNRVAASARPLAMAFCRRRRPRRGLSWAMAMALSDPLLDAQQHVARDREHDEGDDEQDEAERDQRRSVEVADRLGEFVGDRRRDGGAGRQDRGRDLVGIADHEGDRHGLAERAAKPQHEAADHADPR